MKYKLHKDIYDSHMTTNNSILNLLCLFKCGYKICRDISAYMPSCFIGSRYLCLLISTLEMEFLGMYGIYFGNIGLFYATKLSMIKLNAQ